MIYTLLSAKSPYRFLLLLLAGLFSFQPLFGQIFPDAYLNVDYTERPDRAFSIVHMDLALTLVPETHLIRGSVTYELKSLRQDQREIRMRIADSAIDGVSWNGVSVNYEIRSDSLLITLPENEDVSAGELAIIWQSTSKRALIRDHEGNFWNSMDPGTHHRWLPGYAHSRDAYTFDARFTIPADQELIFNGRLTGEEMISTTTKIVTYSSDVPVSTSELSFVMGIFNTTTLTSGLTRIRLFYPAQDPDSLSHLAVLEELTEVKDRLEDVLGRELPWPVLSVVILPDSYWQERHFGAATIRLFENSNMKAGIQRGLISQWIGTFHQDEQYYASMSVQTLLQQQALRLAGYDIQTMNNSTYSYSDKLWNRWKETNTDEVEVIRSSLASSIGQLIRTDASVTALDHYVERIYQNTGISVDRMYPDEQLSNGSESVEDTISTDMYRMDVMDEAANGTLNLIFTLAEGEGSELRSFDLKMTGLSDTLYKQVFVTGAKDTISVKSPKMTEYITVEQHDDLIIGSYPDYFLAAALRSPDTNDRLFAAKTLATHSDNPDLQLALNDALSRETNSRVKAALLEALRFFTGNAAGTENVFINNLRSENQELRLAALSGLSNYAGNEQVISQVRTVVLRSEDNLVFKRALHTLQEIADSVVIMNTVQRILAEPDKAWKGLMALQMVEAIPVQDILNVAERYLDESRPPSVRSQALTVLFERLKTPEERKEQIMRRYPDPDPRIRYQLLSESLKLSRIETLEVLNMARNQEDHPGVEVKINELLREISR